MMGVTMLALLLIISCLTSLLAALIGFGGGMLLIAILPLFLPAIAIVPVHGLTQLASNSSRALFSPQDVLWPLVPGFLAGSVLGVAVFGWLWTQLPVQLLPLFIGFYILLSLWHPGFKALMSRYENFIWLGFIQSGLGLFVGATGPITTSLLLKQNADQNKVIVTAALMMSISHLLKVLVFGWIGFAYLEYLWPLVALITGAVAGSYLGAKIRPQKPDPRYIHWIKLGLSALALQMMIAAFI
ncbi:sulfite exporter TauE/SafE family protein [Rheinheimera soli]|uniref:Probable membrane transporter protein n=1 Tax=Rheinheimera soli TaxID=443616 RepID=A0ABU1VXR3_9GAMM|nr:sulfite exporter TauE/SafE family protein [Rheinheimera soli]MDR7120477.1 putative membrane protein YfcA [Rheinheimera soli]